MNELRETEKRFLVNLLNIVAESPHPQNIYPLLQANLDKLTVSFAQGLRCWIEPQIRKYPPENSQTLAAHVSCLSDLILYFPLGDKAANIAIAKAGYECGLIFYTRERNPLAWAEITMNLGITYEEDPETNPVQKWEDAINCYQKASQVFTREVDPEKWASTQENLGNAYRNRQQGEPEVNLQQAILYHRNALQVFTSHTNAYFWGVSQHNLGNDYLALARLNRADCEQCVESAIEHYEQALQVLKKEVYPDLWAMNQFSLGNAYSVRLQGNLKQNHEKAQQYYEKALIVYTPQTNPFYYQQIKAGQARLNQLKTDSNQANPEESSFVFQVLKLTLASEGDPQRIFPFLEKNLDKLNQNFISELIGFLSALEKDKKQSDIYQAFIMGIYPFSNLMMTFPKGNRKINLDIAIAGWKIVLPFFEGSQSYNLPSDLSSLCGIIKLELGKAFYEKYENKYGKIDVNLQEAIKYFEEGFAILNSDKTIDQELYKESWLSYQIKLGVSYFKRGQIKGNSDDIEKAISTYKLVLSNCQEDNLQWALLQMNLGNAYCWYQGDIDKLNSAIKCHEKSLTVRKQENHPTEWADAQISLGQAYYNRGMLGHLGSAEDIEYAIKCYNNALKVYKDYSKYPYRWVGLQNALGICYSDRRKGNPADNLEFSINNLERLLTEEIKEKYPEYWARSLKSLGVIYFQRRRGHKEANLRKGIDYCEQALQVFTLESYPSDWAEIQQSLGGILYKTFAINLNHNPEYYHKAISYLRETEKVFTPQKNTQSWIKTQFELGTCYKNLGVFAKENREENLANAIKCYQNALALISCKSNPFGWAEINNSLGNAYQHKGQYQKAIKCFEDALNIHSSEEFPTDYMKTKFNLSNAYVKNNQLENAFNGYKEAINILENLMYQLGADDDAKRKLGEVWFQLYSAIIAACLKLGRQNPEYYVTAWEYIERSKARRLVEILGQYKPDDISDNIWKEFQNLRHQITNEYKWIEDRERLTILSEESLSKQPRLARRKIRLTDLEQQLNQKIAAYPKLADTQRVQYTSFSKISEKLSDDYTVIIQWYLLEADGKFCAFIYNRQSSQPYIWESSLEDLGNLEQWSQEYLVNYVSDVRQGKDKLPDRLKHLAEILHIDELLRYLPKNCQRLILIPHRYLHLLPIHALPLEDGTYLLDRYSKGISYYPSFQLLQTIQNPTIQSQRKYNLDNLFAIQNPEDDLRFTNVEVETILSFFPNKSSVLVKEKATKTNFDKYDKFPSTHCCHFSCHGEFNYESPLESALRLANNERLTLADIFKLNLHQCRLVTLSACETGLTDFTSITDEYIGLPSGFLYAGASTVVSSLWVVEEVSTAFLFIKFYENLKSSPELKEGDVATALQNTQNWLRKLNQEECKKFLQEIIDPIFPGKPATAESLKKSALNQISNYGTYPFSNPFYWAAFTATGF